MKQRFDVLDIFRGVFASLVFLFHLGPMTDTVIFNNAFIRSSDMFVDFFFVLSGFVITVNYEKLEGWAAGLLFFKKRILRIYPLHLFILFVFLVIFFAKQPLSAYVHVNNLNNPNDNPATFLSSVFLLNSFPFFGVKDVSWNMPSWSISAEMTSYAIFGLLILAINSLNLHKYRVIFYSLLVVLSLGSLILLTGGFRLNYSFDYGFLRGIAGFFTGAVGYNLYARLQLTLKKKGSAVFSVAELLVCGLLVWALCSGERFKDVGLLYEPLFFSCIFIFSFEKGFISAALKKMKFLHLAGKYSYSIYMTQALVISLFNIAFIRVLKFPPSAYAYLFVLNYAIVFLVSSWTYKHIESRFYHRKKSQAVAA